MQTMPQSQAPIMHAAYLLLQLGASKVELHARGNERITVLPLQQLPMPSSTMSCCSGSLTTTPKPIETRRLLVAGRFCVLHTNAESRPAVHGQGGCRRVQTGSSRFVITSCSNNLVSRLLGCLAFGNETVLLLQEIKCSKSMFLSLR